MSVRSRYSRLKRKRAAQFGPQRVHAGLVALGHLDLAQKIRTAAQIEPNKAEQP